MSKRLRALALIGLVFLAALPGLSAFAQQPDDADASRRLLQQGLTVYELEREIERLAEEEKRLNARLEETARQLEEAKVRIAETKEQAKRVIRSYYMGDRRFVWFAVLSVRSIRDALYVWERLELLLSRDRKALLAYNEQYESYRSLASSLENDRAQLAATKAAYEAEKARKLEAQREVDRLLAENAERDKLEQDLQRVQDEWEQQGLPLFKRYFDALAKAMPQLPKLLGQSQGSVTMKGLNPTVEIGDEALNRFLHEQDETLRNFSFRFEKDLISAGGAADGVEIALKGRYVVEDKPANAVRFRIDSVSFNGYVLPESTARSLEREFDLAIYPSKIAPLFKATDVTIEPGKLTISLKLGL